MPVMTEGERKAGEAGTLSLAVGLLAVPLLAVVSR